MSWGISIEWNDGTLETLGDVPDYVADAVDEWLTEIEREREDG